MVEGGGAPGSDGQLHRFQVLRVAAVGAHDEIAHLGRALLVKQVRRTLRRAPHEDSLQGETEGNKLVKTPCGEGRKQVNFALSRLK